MHKRPHTMAGISLVLAAIAASALPASARPGGWVEPGWGERPSERAPSWSDHSSRTDSREGRIQVSRFVAEGAAANALGHGPIVVSSESADTNFAAPADRAVFEAAVIDQLVHAGYDTAMQNPDGGQIAELRVTRQVLVPAEAPRKPVSGEAAMEVGNRGTAYGMAIAVDMTKPLPALVSTRLEARIRDRATNKVLWEGRAEVAAREGDAHWSNATIASKLSEALFDKFPHAS